MRNENENWVMKIEIWKVRNEWCENETGPNSFLNADEERKKETPKIFREITYSVCSVHSEWHDR